MTIAKKTAATSIAHALLSLPLGTNFESVCSDAEKTATLIVDILKALAFWPVLNKDMREEHEGERKRSRYVDLTWKAFLSYHAKAGEWSRGNDITEKEAREHAANYPELFQAITARIEKKGWF